MRRVNLRDVPMGAVLAKPLVDERGAFVLAAGQKLSTSLVERLWDRGFRYAYIDEFGYDGLEVGEPLPPQTYMHLTQLLRTVANDVRHARHVNDVQLPVEDVLDATRAACAELAATAKGGDFILYPMDGVRMESWVNFSVNAAVLAGLVGLQTGENEARHLFAAGLLQDIGSWRAERVQDHVTVTGDLLRRASNLSPIVRAIAAQHHERVDGSGFPDGKKGEELHALSPTMVVVVAYLELLSGAEPHLPHDAREGLLSSVGVTYPASPVEDLLRLVAAYPTGTTVRLSNGSQGVVVHPGPAGLSRPRVRLLRRMTEAEAEAAGARARGEASGGADALTDPQFEEINLATKFDIAITRVLS